MVPRFAPGGRSFKGVLLYLMHDPDHAATAERLAWTHTLNLAHDDVEQALNEMIGTFHNAETLKAEAGVRGGRPVEKPVKHLSLNWHPSEAPDRKEMVEAAQSFLKHMGWHEHQAILIAHDDKNYRHVHVVLNAIHPETGRKLDDGFEKRRVQVWALAYEQEHGKVFCEQRLKPVAERQASEPRPAWMAIREQVARDLAAERTWPEFDSSYMARAENRQVIERREWEILKDLQKDERIAFFAEGKQTYKDLHRAAYREVREEFRPEWAAHFAAGRKGQDPAAFLEARADLIARQKHVLEERRDAASAELRAARDIEYRAILDVQKQERGELIARQERGITSPQLLARAYPAEKPEAREREKHDEALDRLGIRRGRGAGKVREVQRKPRSTPVSEKGARPVERAVFGAASGLAGGLLAIIGGIGESVMGGHTKPARKPPPEIDPLERFGIQRGRPPPDAAVEQAKRDKDEREAWDAWKAKRDLDRDRSGR